MLASGACLKCDVPATLHFMKFSSHIFFFSTAAANLSNVTTSRSLCLISCPDSKEGRSVLLTSRLLKDLDKTYTVENSR